MKELPDDLSGEIRSTINTVSTTFIPEEISLDTFNSQYLQRNSSSAAAVLASGLGLSPDPSPALSPSAPASERAPSPDRALSAERAPSPHQGSSTHPAAARHPA